MLKHLSVVLLVALAASSTASPAQAPQTSAAQAMDPDYAARVKEWTTKPEFTSPLVDHLPASTGVPSPRDVLGHHIGAPKELTYYTNILRYYDTLAAHSGRVKVIRIGKTEEGRDSVIVFVGSEDSIAHLDEERQNLARIADPRGLSETEAHALIAKTKPIYTLSGGLHSAELGPPEMLMELAYRLATEDSPLIQKIRDNVIVAIMPVADPDGRDRSIDWYYAHNVDITDYEKMSGVPYWGKYTKHDDNRDINYAGMANQNFLKWYLDWHPPIMHDLHESVPFLYIYSGQAPQNPLWDPIVYGELPMLANWDMSQLTKYGMPGVWNHGYVDAWSPGYVAIMATNHNGLMRFYEIFGNAGATTMERTIAPPPSPAIIGGGGGGFGDFTKRQWYRPNPPYKTVLWSMRDNTNYAETGVLNSLQFVSTFPQVILENFYVKSRNALNAGTKEAPYGFILPSDQEDPTRVAFVIHILRMQGIEVGRTRAAIKLSDGSYPAGSLVVKTNQPYGPLAKTLLQKQVDPDPDLTTYDDSAWTMSLMTNTIIKPSDDIAVQAVAVDPVQQYDPEGTLKDVAAAAVYAIADHGSPNMITLRYGLKDVAVQVAEKPFTAAGVSFPAGTFLIPADAGSTLKPLAKGLGLDVVGLAASPKVATHAATLPRLAIFSTWAGTQDVGWVRYTFDQYKVPYDLIFKERVLQGNLAKDYDLILIPNQMRSAKALVIDIPKADKPLWYKKTDKFKYLGDYGSSDDISGGMGAAGVVEFQKFVEGGGMLVTLGTSSAFPPDFGLTPTIDTSNPGAHFYAPGPIVDADILRPENPIFYGYSAKTIPVRYANGPLFRMTEKMDKDDVLMRFPGGEKSVLSGLFNGADDIKGRAAVVVAPAGKGEVVMFATNPVWRWQNVGEYRMVFNTLMNFRDLAPAAATTTPPPSEKNAGVPAAMQ
ncbi:MAG: M14 family zinc carboxypeptidase [Acidobacteriaceae bacterium]